MTEISNKAMFYALMYPHLQAKARELGYALAVHGSMRRDFDLVAVPWTDEAVDAPALVDALVTVVDGSIRPMHDGDPSMPRGKPHGRLAWSIYLASGCAYVDLSVMPRAVAGKEKK